MTQSVWGQFLLVQNNGNYPILDFLLHLRYHYRHLAYWCKRVGQLLLRFNRLVDDDPSKYVDGLLTTYYASYNKDILCDGVLSVSQILKSIQRYKDEILQLGGVGPEWREANQLSKKVDEVTCWIEEVLCLAMVDPDELLMSYQKQQLMYQMSL